MQLIAAYDNAVSDRSFITTLEIACCLCHKQLRFFVVEARQLVNKTPGFVPFQNPDLLIMPEDEYLSILAYLIPEYFIIQHIAFINLSHGIQFRLVPLLLRTPREMIRPDGCRRLRGRIFFPHRGGTAAHIHVCFEEAMPR